MYFLLTLFAPMTLIECDTCSSCASAHDEEKRRVILILLLVILSSVKATNYVFSKAAYEKILETERVVHGETLQKLTRNLTFDGMDGFESDYEDLGTATADQVEGGYYKGVILVPTILAAVHTALRNPESKSRAKEFLWQVSFMFRAIQHNNARTVFGTFTICFDNLLEDYHQTYFRAHMFSAPQTVEDQQYSENVVINLNPLTQGEITAIASKESIHWRLDTLQTLLSHNVERVDSQVYTEKETVYNLKPIIVDLRLLQQYFLLANPDNEVSYMALPPDWQNVASYLFQREVGDLLPRRRRRRLNWLK